MKFAHFAYSTLGLVAAGSLAWGCSSKSSDCNFNKNCGPYDGGAPGTSGASGSSGKGGASGKAGNSGNGGDSGLRQEGGSAGDEGGASGVGGSSGTSGTGGSGGAPCTGTASPDSAQCVIGDEYGLFVSLSGDDATGDGTEAKPLATVTKALSLTGPGKVNRVYVCSTANGSTTSYAEPDTLVIPDRVSIYGGFTCVGGIWAYDTTVKAWLKPVSPVGAIVNNAQNGVTVQDLRIDAMNAPEDGTGASSFGMIVKGSKAVTLTRVEIHAGKGAKGADGANGPTGPGGTPATSLQNGTAANCTPSSNFQDGGKSLAPICSSQGGPGGNSTIGTAVDSDEDGKSGTPNYSVNKGIATASTLTGGTGVSGSVGAAGSPAGTSGTFSASGFVPANGGAGVAGTPGQGGGGGAAAAGNAMCVGASGGAGGMGGCGGDAGSGGKGGGASVALAVWTSEVSLDTCVLASTSAGAGGNGGAGHTGGLGLGGGSGGLGIPLKSLAGAGDGGKGGDGGNGGNGAGGTGGPSIALVYGGTKPVESSVTFSHAASGAAAGTGGQVGAQSNWGPNGSIGAVIDEYEQR